MEGQASRLLTFQSIGQEVFGVQTAFNTVSSYGAGSKVDLRQAGKRIHSEVAAVFGEDERNIVSVQTVHVQHDVDIRAAISHINDPVAAQPQLRSKLFQHGDLAVPSGNSHD